MRKRRPPKSRRVKAKSQRLVIDRLASDGVGLSGDITVPFALPGEEIEAAVTGRSARITRVLQSSNAREQPVCPHFGAPGNACGGCTLQHLGAEKATQLKKTRLEQALTKDGHTVQVSAVHTSPPRSRRRARLAISPHASGFRQYKSHDIVHLDACDVLHPELFAALGPLGRLARKLGATFDAEITLTSAGIDIGLMGLADEKLGYDEREGMADLVREQGWARMTIDGIPVLEVCTPFIQLGDAEVPLPAGAFLQATAEGERALIAEVVSACQGSLRIADLFCGVGTFALPLSQIASVSAWDAAPEAIAALNAAAKRSALPVHAEPRDLFRRPLTQEELSDFDTIVFDPPRAGARDQAAAIAAASPKTIVAVSCNPATLARDAQSFENAYTLERAAMIDQFGWSPHVEAVAVFRRRT